MQQDEAGTRGMPAPYHIGELLPSNEAVWTAFNEQETNGSFFHTLHWKSAFERSFGARPRYFMVFDSDDRVVALCPFFEYSLHGFRGLMSLPRTGVNYLLVRDGVLDATLFRAVHAACTGIARTGNLSFFQIASQSSLVPGYIGDYRYLPYPSSGNMVLDIRKYPPGEIWDSVFSTKGAQRKYIRQFEKSGIEPVECRGEGLLQFADRYCSNLSRAGKHSLPVEHFAAIGAACPPESFRLTMLEDGGTFYGGLLSFLFPPAKTVFMEYLAVNRDAPNRFHAPYMLWWDTIRYAAENGYSSVCFGGTPADPENIYYRQKKGFGCEFVPNFSYIFPSRLLFRLAYSAWLAMKQLY